VTATDGSTTNIDITAGNTGVIDANSNILVASSNDAAQTVDTLNPTFTMQYYSDTGLTTEIDGGSYKKAGTYYIKITASEALGSTPTVTLTAEGTANDVTDGATTLVAGNVYKYTRTIAADVLAIGTVLEGISVTGTDANGNASTNVDPTNEAAKEIYTDTVAPVVTAGADAGSVAEQFSQDATASDTGGSGIASYLWSKNAGPYTVTFGTGTAVDTTVSAAGEGFYTIRLTVTDTAGNSATDDATFTWGAVNVPIVAYSPVNGATDTAIADGTATITFGGSLNITLLDATKVTLVANVAGTSKKGTVAVSGGDGTSKILNIPYTGLANSTVYRINILSGAVMDSSGHINSDGVSYFTTVAAAGDEEAPTVDSQSPVNGATSTAITVSPTVTFSEAMDASTVNTNTVQLRALTGDAIIDANVTYNATSYVATIDPSASLTNGTSYYVWVSGAKDVAGNTVTAYTTAAAQDFETVAAGAAPTVTAQSPVNGASSQAITVSPTVTFSEAMDATTVNTNTVQLRALTGDAIVNSVVTYTGTTATIDPVASLSNSTSYYVWVSGAKNAAGTTMTAYTTGADQDFGTVAAGAAPTVTAQTPVNGATSTAITVSPTVTFSEAMDATTVNTNTVQLRALTGDAIVNSVVTYTGTTATIDPVDSLSNSTSYYVWVSGAKNAAGTTMTAYTTSADQDFATVALGNGSLAVTSISSIETYAAVAGGWPDGSSSTADGWSWNFYITVPTTETSFAMKFANWTSGSNTIAAASNIRFFSAQASANADSDNARLITVAGTDSTAITLTSDLDAATAGRQIMVTVQAQIPTGSSAGAYSTQYGVTSN